MLRGFWAVVDMAFRLFFRDKQTLFWGIAFPLIMMGLVGNVFGGTMNLVISTSVVADDNNPIREDFIAALEDIPTLRVVLENEATALEALRQGERSIVIVLPSAEETRSILQSAQFIASNETPLLHFHEPLPVLVYFDDANFEVSQAGVAIVQQVIDGMNNHIVPRVNVFSVDARGIAGEQFSMFDFLLPGMLAMVLMQSGLMNVTAVITSYRQRLILKRVLATPFPPLAFLTGLVARFTVTNILQGIIIIIVGVVVFKVNIEGSYANILFLSLLGSVTFLTMGFAISTLSKSADGANAFGSAISFPMMFLSGTFWPREFIPQALQPIIDALPLTPLVEALRGVATQGDTLAMHINGIAYMALWAVVSLIIAARRFRWD